MSGTAALGAPGGGARVQVPAVAAPWVDAAGAVGDVIGVRDRQAELFSTGCLALGAGDDDGQRGPAPGAGDWQEVAVLYQAVDGGHRGGGASQREVITVARVPGCMARAVRLDGALLVRFVRRLHQVPSAPADHAAGTGDGRTGSDAPHVLAGPAACTVLAHHDAVGRARGRQSARHESGPRR
ncbi:hypothetical protein GCM10017687_65830 [Streptomyces echinatus]